MGYLFLLVIQQLVGFSQSIAGKPTFSEPISNVTVPVGRDAIMTCIVQDLNLNMVAWLHVATQTILTIQNRVVSNNIRIGIINTENRMWQLRIKDVREDDRGWYMCQINTIPMQSQLGYLDVVVPPDILDALSSSDTVVNEGDNVTFICTASGFPTPQIHWKRENGKPIKRNGTEEVYQIEGNNLIINRVNRNHKGDYLCIASNGIPPTISKRINLKVNFAPIVKINHHTVYSSNGQKILLECTIESYPRATVYWTKDDQQLPGIIWEEETNKHAHRIVLRLTVSLLNPNQFGIYNCIAFNSRGKSMKTVNVVHQHKTYPSLNDLLHSMKIVPNNFTLSHRKFKPYLHSNTSVSIGQQNHLTLLVRFFGIINILRLILRNN